MKSRLMAKKTRVVPLMLTAFLLLPFVLFAGAAEPDYTVPCALNVTMRSSSGRAVSGGSAAIYLVAVKAAANAGAEWEYTGDFSGCGIDEAKLRDVSAAAELEKYAKAKAITGVEKAIDDEGNTSFQELCAGLYLFSQTRAAPGYRAASAFLIELPYFSEAENMWCYTVTAFPKTNPRAAVTPVIGPGKPSLPDLFDDYPSEISSSSEDGKADGEDAAGGDEMGTGDTQSDVLDGGEPDSQNAENDGCFEVSDDTNDMDTNEEAAVGQTELLPKTGQVWWPAPVLAVIGAYMLLMSRVLKKDGDGDE